MGGKALEAFGARRFAKEEYAALSLEIKERIKKFSPLEIPAYFSKETFGDLDLIVPTLQKEDYEEICVALNSWIFLRNDDVMSILYDGLQIDIIPMSPENIVTAYNYYSFNDLGNLMGKIFHKFGLKYGHRGLTMPVRDGTHQITELVISKDIQKIFEFGDFEYSHFKEGFNDLKEIFSFVLSTSYFNSDVYQYESLNHHNRIRDRKRATYHAFLEYLKQRIRFNGEWTSLEKLYSTEEMGYRFSENKDDYIPMIFDFFPEAKADYDIALAQRELQRAIKAKYNGNVVMEITGLKGISLGEFMGFLKRCWDEEEVNLLDKSEDWIKGQIFAIYKEWVV